MPDPVPSRTARSTTTDGGVAAEAARIAGGIRSVLDHQRGTLRREAEMALDGYNRVLSMHGAVGPVSPRRFRTTTYVLASLLMMNDDKTSFDLANDLLTLLRRSPDDPD